MKTTLRELLSLAAAALAGTVLLASCEKEPQEPGGAAVPLAKPEIIIGDQTPTSFTATWTAVENADSYTYILDDGQEQATKETSVKFTGLESGNYTIKVKATSADKESFSDSEWAEARVSLREPDQLAAPVLSITEQDMTSFTVAWEAVENAASYKYALNDGQELTTEELSVSFPDLTPGEYTVRVMAVATDPNFKDSAWSDIKVVLKAPEKLDTPAPTVQDKSATSFTVSWVAVENAGGYVYMLDNGQEEETDGTSVTFNGLTPGTTYTLKVKATSDNEAYIDSDWSEPLEVTLENEIEESFSMTLIEDLFTNQESLSWSATGSGVTAVNYIAFEADRYDDNTIIDMMINQSQSFTFTSTDIARLAEGKAVNYNSSGLTTGTPYDICCYVRFESGNEQLYKLRGTPGEPIDGGEESGVEAWTGTWTISSTQSFSWAEDPANPEFVISQLTDTPKTGVITIAADPNAENSVIISGLSGITQMAQYNYPAYGYVDEENRLVLNNNEVLGSVGENQMLTWCAFSYIENMPNPEGGTYAPFFNYVNGEYEAFVFSLDGDTATSAAASGTLNGGGTFTVVSYDLYALTYTGTSISTGIYHQIEDSSYAGEITLTRQSGGTNAARQAYMPSFSAPSYSVLKVTYPSAVYAR